MADIESLTLAFLTAHPSEAARVLERLPGGQAADFFARVPARVGAPALVAMLPTAAARVLGALEDAPALALLTSVGVQAAVGVLRYVAEPRRAHLIEGLPTATAVASRLLLGYPEDSVGAWVDPDVIAMAPETPSRDALERVRNGEEANIDRLYTIDGERRLIGIVELAALMRAPETVSLEVLMHKPTAVLTAMTPLTGAASQRGWERASALPVVERGGRLIGILPRATLARALARNRATSQADAEVSLAGIIGRGYWDTVSGLTEAAIALLPAAKPVHPEPAKTP